MQTADLLRSFRRKLFAVVFCPTQVYHSTRFSKRKITRRERKPDGLAVDSFAGIIAKIGTEMSFEITIQGDFFLFRLYGVVTSVDLDRIASEVEVMEDSLPTAINRITDLTEVERFDVSFPAVNILAGRRSGRQFSKPVKSAIIVRESVQFGLARMYQMLNDNSQIEIRILRSLTEAKDWFADRTEQGTL